jgi:hypothetical protein
LINSATCRQFARILKATRLASPGVCFVTRQRSMNVRVMGRRTKSPVVLMMAFSFEDVRSNGKALCFGEWVFRQAEVKPFLNAISNKGIRVTAVHNHWLLESPRLIYIHWEAIMEPLRFARISSRALDTAMR